MATITALSPTTLSALHTIDALPLLGTIKVVVDLFARTFWNPNVKNLGPAELTYYIHIKEKTFFDFVALAIPFMGTIWVLSGGMERGEAGGDKELTLARRKASAWGSATENTYQEYSGLKDLYETGSKEEKGQVIERAFANAVQHEGACEWLLEKGGKSPKQHEQIEQWFLAHVHEMDDGIQGKLCRKSDTPRPIVARIRDIQIEKTIAGRGETIPGLGGVLRIRDVLEGSDREGGEEIFSRLKAAAEENGQPYVFEAIAEISRHRRITPVLQKTIIDWISSKAESGSAEAWATLQRCCEMGVPGAIGKLIQQMPAHEGFDCAAFLQQAYFGQDPKGKQAIADFLCGRDSLSSPLFNFLVRTVSGDHPVVVARWVLGKRRELSKEQLEAFFADYNVDSSVRKACIEVYVERFVTAETLSTSIEAILQFRPMAPNGREWALEACQKAALQAEGTALAGAVIDYFGRYQEMEDPIIKWLETMAKGEGKQEYAINQLCQRHRMLRVIGILNEIARKSSAATKSFIFEALSKQPLTRGDGKYNVQWTTLCTEAKEIPAAAYCNGLWTGGREAIRSFVQAANEGYLPAVEKLALMVDMDADERAFWCQEFLRLCAADHPKKGQIEDLLQGMNNIAPPSEIVQIKRFKEGRLPRVKREEMIQKAMTAGPEKITVGGVSWSLIEHICEVATPEERRRITEGNCPLDALIRIAYMVGGLEREQILARMGDEALYGIVEEKNNDEKIVMPGLIVLMKRETDKRANWAENPPKRLLEAIRKRFMEISYRRQELIDFCRSAPNGEKYAQILQLCEKDRDRRNWAQLILLYRDCELWKEVTEAAAALQEETRGSWAGIGNRKEVEEAIQQAADKA